MSFRALLPVLIIAAVLADVLVRHVAPRLRGSGADSAAGSAAPVPAGDPGSGVTPYEAPDSVRVSKAIDAALLKGRYLLSGGSGLRVSRQYRYYDVEGRTVQEVARSLRSTVPRVSGNEAFGVTNVSGDWRLDSPDPASCSAEQISVEMAFIITLPRWRQPSGASGELIREWRRFEEGLRRHEREHQQIALAVAQSWLARGRAIRSRSCDEIRHVMEEDQRLRVVPELQRLQSQYDAEARTGKRAGGAWPES